MTYVAAMITKEGAVMAADSMLLMNYTSRHPDKTDCFPKIIPINDHVVVAGAGVVRDIFSVVHYLKKKDCETASETAELLRKRRVPLKAEFIIASNDASEYELVHYVPNKPISDVRTEVGQAVVNCPYENISNTREVPGEYAQTFADGGSWLFEWGMTASADASVNQNLQWLFMPQDQSPRWLLSTELLPLNMKEGKTNDLYVIAQRLAFDAHHAEFPFGMTAKALSLNERIAYAEVTNAAHDLMHTILRSWNHLVYEESTTSSETRKVIRRMIARRRTLANEVVSAVLNDDLDALLEVRTTYDRMLCSYGKHLGKRSP